MTLFANRFIENVPAERYGVDAFCQPDVKVKAWQFLVEVPMIAFWHLRENNCIRFTPAVKQGFIRNSPTLLIEANPAAEVNFPGLEYDFWQIIKDKPPGISVEMVFQLFLGGHRSDPERNVFDRLIAWLLQLKFGKPDNSPKPFIRFDNVPPFEKFAPDCPAIAAQEPTAQIIHKRWTKFKAAQPELFYYLFDDVVDAGVDRASNSQSKSSSYYRARSFRDTGKE